MQTPDKPSSSRQLLTYDKVWHILFGLLLAAAIIFVLDYLKGALLPFCIGCMIAFLIEPIVNWNMRVLHLKRRLIPVLLTIIEVGGVITGFVAIFSPTITSDIHAVSNLMKHYAGAEASTMGVLPRWLHEWLQANIDFSTLSSYLSSDNLDKTLNTAGKFLSGGLSELGSLLSWLMVILYVFFILLNYPVLMGGIKKIVPPKYRHISNAVISDVSYTMKKYFRTQALIALIAGVIYAVGFSIVGLPLAIAIAILNAVLFMVPYLVYISLIPVTLLCLLTSLETGVDFWLMWGKCLCVYAVAECASDIWLTPKLMGKSLNLDPAIILLALSVWGSLLGLLGMIIALPLTTIIISYYRIYVLDDPDGKIKGNSKGNS